MKNIILNIEADFEAIIAWLCAFNTFKLFCIKTMIMIPILGVIQIFLPIPDLPFATQNTVAMQLLVTVLVMPYLETIIFHSYLIQLGLKYTGIKSLTVFLSAILFGSLHSYSGGYILAATISGLIYGTYYFTFRRKFQDPVLRIYLLHAANNLITVILSATT